MKELNNMQKKKKVKRNETDSDNETKKHLPKMHSFESSLLKTMNKKALTIVDSYWFQLLSTHSHR